jgi:CRP-like cAMP-binding protein
MPGLDRSVIADLPMFAGLATDQLDSIVKEAQSVRYSKGTNVFEQDAPATSFFILLHGHLRVAKLTPAGQQVVVRFVAPGEIFGVAKAIGRTTYPATATAVVDSVALSWPSAAWPRLVENNPALAANALQTVGSRLQEAHTRVVEMSTEQVERRVAHALLRLAKQAGRQKIVIREAHKLFVLAEGDE